jgi:hypothetical protein
VVRLLGTIADGESVSAWPATVAPNPAPHSGPRELPSRAPRVEAPALPERVDGAIAFAAEEAVRQVRQGASVAGGAHEVLRWASRRRTVIKAAVTQLSDDTDLDAATREAAVAILERVLAFGLLF